MNEVELAEMKVRVLKHLAALVERDEWQQLRQYFEARAARSRNRLLKYRLDDYEQGLNQGEFRVYDMLSAGSAMLKVEIEQAELALDKARKQAPIKDRLAKAKPPRPHSMEDRNG